MPADQVPGAADHDAVDQETDVADSTGVGADQEDDGFVGFVAPMIGAAGGVLLLGGLAWWGATRDLSTGVIALLAVGAVLIGLYVAIHGRDLIAWGSTRSARRGSAATIQSIAIIGILGVVNFAHGGFYVMGGYVAYYCSVVLGLPFPVAVLAASQPFGLMTAGVAAAVLGQWRFERDVMINGSIAGALGLGGLAGLDLRLRRMPRP